jgi:thiamine-monophosphate kinase
LSLRELGELKIIDMLEQTLGSSPRAIVGFGDDISAILLPGGKAAILKTDMLVGSTDIPPGMTMRQAARKAVVASVSDMAAKGVRPLAGLVALGLPSRLTRKDVRDLAKGFRDAEDEYGFALVGGDTNESRDLTISIALFAIADPRKLVLRSGARSGDIVAVSGEFGDASAGLKALIENRKKPRELDRPLYDAVFHPRAQLSLGIKLADSKTLSASIDSSDGLAWSLHELAKATSIGIEINTIPVSKSAQDYAKRYRYDAEKLALYGGEEYHLIVTVKRHKLELASRAARGKLRPIGVVTREFRGVRLTRSGRTVNIPRKGWEHFKTR